MNSLLRKNIIIFICCNVFTSQVYAVRTTDVAINVTATVVIPPCEINKGTTAGFTFDNIDKDDINNNENVQERVRKIDLEVSCPPGVSKAKDLTFTIAGIKGGTPNQIVTQEDATHAAIGFYSDAGFTKPLRLSQPILISDSGSVTGSFAGGYTGKLIFFARVEKKSAIIDVYQGEFSAIATIVLEQE